MIPFSVTRVYAAYTFKVDQHVNYFRSTRFDGKSMKGEQPMLGTILLIFLILLLLGAFSGKRRWGYFPSGGLGLVILVVVVLLLVGRI